VSVLVLVKHSLPEIREGVPASLWHLSAEGVQRAHLLAPKIAGFRLQCIFSSQEPKAAETAQILADDLKLPCQTLPNLHEHIRPTSTNFRQAAFEADVEALFARPNELVFGGETADQAHERFREALAGIVEANLGQNLAIVSHGTVISLFVSRACGIDPFPLWKSLGLPSYLVLDMTHYPQMAQMDA
jgi:broad specificity phosphatase PhoE